MDEIIKEYNPKRVSADLTYCYKQGVAYQTDMMPIVPYGNEYFDKYVGYESNELSPAINKYRSKKVNKYCTKRGMVLDIGIGSGDFIRTRKNTLGWDVNPKAHEWLNRNKKMGDMSADYDGYCFWDVLEHIRKPSKLLRRIQPNAYCFVSIPIFKDLNGIKISRHYRPDEHFYYFTEDGFIQWMSDYGFDFLETDNFEIRAGRHEIISFVFRKTNYYPDFIPRK